MIPGEKKANVDLEVNTNVSLASVFGTGPNTQAL
jgi:hypothetical protein